MKAYKKFGLTLLLFIWALLLHAQKAHDLFAQVPSSVLPLLDKTARLDLLDLYDSGLTAKAENVLGGQTEMQKKTTDYIKLKTSEVGTWEMKVLPTTHDTLIVCIYTLKAVHSSSTVSIYSSNWNVSKHNLPSTSFETFYTVNRDLPATKQRTIESMLRNLPVKAYWNEDDNTLTYELSLDGLSEADKKVAEHCTHSVAFSWNSDKWVLK